jgi:hypothetical protein
MVPPAATVRRRRRAGSTGVFVGGVLCTLSAWVIGLSPFMVRVRAGAMLQASIRLVIFVHTYIKKVNTFMGRPPGRIQKHPFQMRVSAAFLKVIDKWREQQEDKPSRAEAIRRLVELGLKASASTDQRYQTKASESASKAGKLAAGLKTKQ